MNKYLNIGCGSNYSKTSNWVNLDFISLDKDVISHNLLNGIPFPNDTFDLVYHSHVLEHFKKRDAEYLLKECYRVLKPGGVLRVVVPDLEKIVRHYIDFLDKGLNDFNSMDNKFNYEWIMLELFDQTTRESSGGSMFSFLTQDVIPNEKFVFQRIGKEGLDLRQNYLNHKSNVTYTNKIKIKIIGFINRIMDRFDFIRFYKIGKFRLSGEIHQYMYDRYSLKHLLTSLNFIDFQTRNSSESYLNNWSDYDLDCKSGIVRKPDSLFVEVRKPF
jgi:predicted SAM-dependent methyltransferase